MNKPIAELKDKKRELEEKLTKLLEIAIPTSQSELDELEKESWKGVEPEIDSPFPIKPLGQANFETQNIGKWDEPKPENSRTFTLAEVEQIAREAHVDGYSTADAEEDGNFFEKFWANKLKEINK